MNREELIEEARTFVTQSHIGRVTARELDRAILLIRRMVETFEQTHTPAEAHVKPVDTSPEPIKNGADSLHVTPTDDEREALAQIVRRVIDAAYTFDGDLDPSVDEILIRELVVAGFRRTVQGSGNSAQNSDDERERIEQCATCGREVNAPIARSPDG